MRGKESRTSSRVLFFFFGRNMLRKEVESQTRRLQCLLCIQPGLQMCVVGCCSELKHAAA